MRDVLHPRGVIIHHFMVSILGDPEIRAEFDAMLDRYKEYFTRVDYFLVGHRVNELDFQAAMIVATNDPVIRNPLSFLDPPTTWRSPTTRQKNGRL
jgi:hypothetical protein